MSMKYKGYYYTTRKEVDGHIWIIRNKKMEVLQVSDEFFTTKREAELDAQYNIDEYWEH